MNHLYFNFGLADITPEESVLLAGFANRSGASTGIHRQLTSRCLALKQDKTVICLIVNDLMEVDVEIINSIKIKIAEQTGIDKNNIIITCVHTHSAPLMGYDVNEANDRYTKSTCEKITDNACKTILHASSFKKGFLRAGQATCAINIHRKLIVPEDGSPVYKIGDPNGLRDEQVNILQITDEKENPQVTLFNYACHPVTLGYKSLIVSTDYPGKAREIIEQAWGGNSIFMTGANGDLNPIEAHRIDTAVTDKVGEQLGKAVLSSALKSYNHDIDLKIISDNILIPYRDKNITKKFIEQEVIRKSTQRTEFINWKQDLTIWRDKIFRQIDDGKISDSFPFHVTALKLGVTVIFFTQGELYVKYQIDLKKQFPDNQIMCAAYAHGQGAYIPTADVFTAKGYETDQAYIYEYLPSPFTEQIEQAYSTQAKKLIEKIIS